MSEQLTLALPKGRLYEQVKEYFGKAGFEFEFKKRKLIAHDDKGLFKIMLVKNSDLPTYVGYGIAGLGICGEDTIYESGFSFSHLMPFKFGGTKICLAGEKNGKRPGPAGPGVVASKFTKFTRDYYHKKGMPVKVIKLNGSVELAPLLGLAPYIVDLVETGSTLVANNLEVIDTLKEIKVFMVANLSYYKVHYKTIDALVKKLKGLDQ